MSSRDGVVGGECGSQRSAVGGRRVDIYCSTFIQADPHDAGMS